MKRFLRIARRLIALALLALLLVFCVNNRGPLALSLFPLPYEMVTPVYLAALLVFALGLITGYLSAGTRLVRLNRLLSKSREREQAVEQERRAREIAPLP